MNQCTSARKVDYETNSSHLKNVVAVVSVGSNIRRFTLPHQKHTPLILALGFSQYSNTIADFLVRCTISAVVAETFHKNCVAATSVAKARSGPRSGILVVCLAWTHVFSLCVHTSHLLLNTFLEMYLVATARVVTSPSTSNTVEANHRIQVREES